MKPKPWEGKYWKIAEKKIDQIMESDIDSYCIYEIQFALTSLKDALKKDYEELNNDL